MIPENLDDGFTVEVAEGVFCRPMLWKQKQEFKPTVSSNIRRAKRILLDTPFRFGWGEPADHEIKVIQFVLGYREKESQDFQELSDAVDLQRVNPGLSELSCSDCQQYCVDHSAGAVQYDGNGSPKKLPGGINVPCETHQGCLKGHYTRPRGLSNPRWAKTWRHWWWVQGQADHPLVNCPLFRRNAMLLNWTVNYGRHRRFDPFIVGSPGGGASTEPSAGVAGSNCNRTGCTGGSCSGGAGGARCSTETPTAGDNQVANVEPARAYVRTYS